jgi:hypothetical protein
MALSDFIPSLEYKKFEEQYGEDTFINLNLLYIAFEMDELNDENITGNEFDELCKDVLEISLDEDFESYSIIDVADAIIFIIHDSNYTVNEYETTYKRRHDKICEELLAYLDDAREDGD